MGHLRIDADGCVGCGRCVRVCPTGNLEVIEKKAVEQNTGCLGCSHCISICPKGAIGFEEGGRKGWLDGRMVTSDEFAELSEHTARRSGGDADVLLIDGERLDAFMELVRDIVDGMLSATTFGAYGHLRGLMEPLVPSARPWTGQQLLLIFSDDPTDAVRTAVGMQEAGMRSGIAGIPAASVTGAARLAPGRVAGFFPEVTSERPLRLAFILGHGRRLVEPLIAPPFALIGRLL